MQEGRGIVIFFTESNGKRPFSLELEGKGGGRERVIFEGAGQGGSKWVKDLIYAEESEGEGILFSSTSVVLKGAMLKMAWFEGHSSVELGFFTEDFNDTNRPTVIQIREKKAEAHKMRQESRILDSRKVKLQEENSWVFGLSPLFRDYDPHFWWFGTPPTDTLFS